MRVEAMVKHEGIRSYTHTQAGWRDATRKRGENRRLREAEKAIPFSRSATATGIEGDGRRV